MKLSTMVNIWTADNLNILGWWVCWDMNCLDCQQWVKLVMQLLSVKTWVQSDDGWHLVRAPTSNNWPTIWGESKKLQLLSEKSFNWQTDNDDKVSKLNFMPSCPWPLNIFSEEKNLYGREEGFHTFLSIWTLSQTILYRNKLTFRFHRAYQSPTGHLCFV